MSVRNVRVAFITFGFLVVFSLHAVFVYDINKCKQNKGLDQNPQELLSDWSECVFLLEI